jgi:hypothetical protein
MGQEERTFSAWKKDTIACRFRDNGGSKQKKGQLTI